MMVDFHGVATIVSQRLLFSVVGGTLLAAAVWLLLRIFPKRDSRTNFAIWFSTLLATAMLPLLSVYLESRAVAPGGSPAVFTVSTSIAWYAFIAWAVIAFMGLARVVLATFQLRRLRADAMPVEMESLPAEIGAIVEEAQKSRPVSVLVSDRLEVPTAIGFSNPAVILPAWMVESTPAEELKYILLHELAHLRRRDDWTNLAQKILKALLFFLPSVWWIERRLSLDREMACDDAVLVHSGTPHGYAECLAHVAERSFLRKQIALAQAAVGRVRQLTARVTRILDPERPQATQLWKPAVPAVMVVALLCAVPASFTPELIGFGDGASAATAQTASQGKVHINPSLASNISAQVPEVQMVPASLKTSSEEIAPGKVKATVASRNNRVHAHPANRRKGAQTLVMAKNQSPAPEQYVTVREEMFFVVTQRTPSGEQQSWQVHMWQVSLQPRSKVVQKPQKI
ncbi:MAG TPA: M56 family metallopeptidase [Candidatus Angelobacter sp.]|jgi:beta-lactamase regulating signal transducer with metallopeptidase domain